MLYKVSRSVRKKATECPRELACLGTGHCGDLPLCTVKSNADTHCLTLDSETCVLTCPYRVPFGRRQVCTCPVRIELYRKYGL